MPLPLLLLTLASCATPETPPVAPPEAPPLPLAEQLYAGEGGDAAAALGDKVRLLAWLGALQADDAQLAGLRDAALRVQGLLAELRRRQAVEAEAEHAALAPLYREVAAELAKPTPDEQALEVLGARLDEARVALGNPERARAAMVRAVLDEAAAALLLLREDQRPAMRHALFLVRRQLTPDDAAWLVQTAWSDEDFATLRRLQREAPPAGAVDLGRLWAERDRDPTAGIEGARLLALVTLALAHPELPRAIDVRQGRLSVAVWMDGAP